MFSKPITPSNGKIVNAAQGQRTTEIPDAQWCEMQQITKHGNEVKKESGVIIASQNFNGFMNESKREEISTQMKRMGIGIVVGQEGAMYDAIEDDKKSAEKGTHDRSLQRWDTDELYLSFGNGNRKKKAGNCFILSKKWADAFEKGGRQVKRYCDRLVTMRIPMKNRKNLYLVNAHAPDSGKTAAMREAFQLKLETAMQNAKHDDMMVLIGDMNASMGIKVDDVDEVFGPHGLQHQNAAGRQLKVLAGAHNMRDLVSRQEQKFYGTWHCMSSNLPHQLDNALIQAKYLSAVKKCVNATPLVNTDHASIRLHLKIERVPSPPRTKRQERAHNGVATWLQECAVQEKMKLGTLAAEQYGMQLHDGKDKSEYDMLMGAVETVLANAPERKRAPRGWCDLNVEVLCCGIEMRNTAARNYVKTRTDETKRVYTIARQKLKKIKTRLKNEWLLLQLQQCNDSILPGGWDRKSC